MDELNTFTFGRRPLVGAAVAGAMAAHVGQAAAQTPDAVPGGDFAGEINRILSDQTEEAQFAGAVLVSEDGETLFEGAYGEADRLSGEPNTIETGFQIASITKTFTAAQIMQLRNDGAFTLDDPVSALLPDFADQLDSGETPVTIGQLLNHTAGIPDFLDLYDMFDVENYPDSLDILLEGIAAEPLGFEPGTEFGYSNSGYLYLGRIIEAVTGQPWEEALRERITAPLGLDQTWLSPPAERSPLATGYLTVEGLVLPVSRFGRPDLAEAAGGLTSTTADLLTWTHAFMAGEVVDLNTVEEMLTPKYLGYGLGWDLLVADGVEWNGHYGETIGFCSALAHHRDRNATVIILSNRQDFHVGDLTRQLLELVQTI